jgi:hypothetical protein
LKLYKNAPRWDEEVSTLLNRRMSSEQLIEKLQKLPAKYHWALADYGLLYSILGNIKYKRSKAPLIIFSLIKFLSKIRLEWCFIFAFGISNLLLLLFKQKKQLLNEGQRPQFYPYYFVGFGVAKEEAIFTNYSKDKCGHIVRLSQYNIFDFSSLQVIKIKNAYYFFKKSIKLAKESINLLPIEFTSRKNDFLNTHCD